MEDSYLYLIEESISNGTIEKFEELSLKLDIPNSQLNLFLNYFQKFSILSLLLDSKYVNYFNKITLTDLREKDELTDENFVKAIIIFIKEKRKNKKWYYISLQNENDIHLQILILSKLDYKSFIFEIDFNKNLDLKKNLNIFKYITYIDDNYPIKKLTTELIENEINSPIINLVNIDEISFDKVLNYSKKYPNRIRFIEYYDFKEYNKLKELIELNKESLLNYPHSNIKYLIPLKNAIILNLTDINEKINDNYDLSKIIEVCEIGFYEDKIEFIIDLLNKCYNVEVLKFNDITSEGLFYILKNINCPKVKKIYGVCENIDQEYDWNKIFEKMPLLEMLSIDEHQTMFWTYSIFPIFNAENKRLKYPLLEQLIRNYLNGSPDRDIKLQFDDEFDEFWDYFKDKKDIISRISQLNGEDVFFPLDSYFKITFSEYEETIDKIKDAKYYFCFVEIDFDDKIFNFVKRNEIEYLFILNGGKINLNELKKCDKLKFVFDKITKKFLFRKDKNNILEEL